MKKYNIAWDKKFIWLSLAARVNSQNVEVDDEVKPHFGFIQ